MAAPLKVDNEKKIDPFISALKKGIEEQKSLGNKQDILTAAFGKGIEEKAVERTKQPASLGKALGSFAEQIRRAEQTGQAVFPPGPRATGKQPTQPLPTIPKGVSVQELVVIFFPSLKNSFKRIDEINNILPKAKDEAEKTKLKEERNKLKQDITEKLNEETGGDFGENKPLSFWNRRNQQPTALLTGILSAASKGNTELAKDLYLASVGMISVKKPKDLSDLLKKISGQEDDFGSLDPEEKQKAIEALNQIHDITSGFGKGVTAEKIIQISSLFGADVGEPKKVSSKTETKKKEELQSPLVNEFVKKNGRVGVVLDLDVRNAIKKQDTNSFFEALQKNERKFEKFLTNEVGPFFGKVSDKFFKDKAGRWGLAMFLAPFSTGLSSMLLNSISSQLTVEEQVQAEKKKEALELMKSRSEAKKIELQAQQKKDAQRETTKRTIIRTLTGNGMPADTALSLSEKIVRGETLTPEEQEQLQENASSISAKDYHATVARLDATATSTEYNSFVFSVGGRFNPMLNVKQKFKIRKIKDGQVSEGVSTGTLTAISSQFATIKKDDGTVVKVPIVAFADKTQLGGKRLTTAEEKSEFDKLLKLKKEKRAEKRVTLEEERLKLSKAQFEHRKRLQRERDKATQEAKEQKINLAEAKGRIKLASRIVNTRKKSLLTQLKTELKELQKKKKAKPTKGFPISGIPLPTVPSAGAGGIEGAIPSIPIEQQIEAKKKQIRILRNIEPNSLVTKVRGFTNVKTAKTYFVDNINGNWAGSIISRLQERGFLPDRDFEHITNQTESDKAITAISVYDKLIKGKTKVLPDELQKGFYADLAIQITETFFETGQ